VLAPTSLHASALLLSGSAFRAPTTVFVTLSRVGEDLRHAPGRSRRPHHPSLIVIVIVIVIAIFIAIFIALAFSALRGTIGRRPRELRVWPPLRQ
jgi:hypothetical protein